MTAGTRSGFAARRKCAAVLAVIVLVPVAGGYGFYRMEAKEIRLVKYNELAAIGELKAGQIARWRRERLDDVLEDVESPFFVEGVEAWLKDPGNAVLRDEFRQRLKLEQRTEDVAGALLLDVDGRVLLAAKDDPDPVDATTVEYRMQEALRQSEALYRSLVDNTPQCILRKDLEGRFTFADESFCLLLGKSPEETLGKTDFDFYPSDLAEKHRNDERHVVETLVEFETDEKNILPTGEILYVHVIKVPIKDASGEAVGIQCIFEDITNRKRAEEELKQRMEELAAWHEATIGREGRVMELKVEVNELLAKLGHPPRYESPGA